MFWSDPATVCILIWCYLLWSDGVTCFRKHDYKTPPLEHIFNKLNSVSILRQIYLNIILSSVPMYWK